MTTSISSTTSRDAQRESRRPDEPDPQAVDAGQPAAAVPDGTAIAKTAETPAVEPSEKPTEAVRSEVRAQRRLEDGAHRADVVRGWADPTNKTFTERVTTESRPVADHIARRVSEWSGAEPPRGLGLATLAPGEVAKEARLAANLGHQLGTAREAGDADAVAGLETRITERFGSDGVAAVDEALRTADAAGTRPELFTPRSGYSRGDPHSVALQEALTPFASQNIYRRHVGEEQTAALDDAYAKLGPERRAQLELEVQAIRDDRGFFEGAGQAFKDTGTDLWNSGKLAWSLATDGAARERFVDNVGAIADAIADPERRDEAIKLIGSELGAGLVEAFQKFGDDPDYYSGYLAGTVAAGGAVGKLAKLGSVAARLGGGRVVDFASRIRIESHGLGANGANMRIRLSDAPRFPVALKRAHRRALTGAYDDVRLGRGVPRIDPATGTQTIFRATDIRDPSFAAKWRGAVEWDVPGTDNNLRILQRPDGVLGYVIGHDYSAVRQFPLSHFEGRMP